jgi:hypothetical protein
MTIRLCRIGRRPLCFSWWPPLHSLRSAKSQTCPHFFLSVGMVMRWRSSTRPGCKSSCTTSGGWITLHGHQSKKKYTTKHPHPSPPCSSARTDVSQGENGRVQLCFSGPLSSPLFPMTAKYILSRRDKEEGWANHDGTRANHPSLSPITAFSPSSLRALADRGWIRVRPGRPDGQKEKKGHCTLRGSQTLTWGSSSR